MQRCEIVETAKPRFLPISVARDLPCRLLETCDKKKIRRVEDHYGLSVVLSALRLNGSVTVNIKVKFRISAAALMLSAVFVR